jgi:hypothetical protein
VTLYSSRTTTLCEALRRTLTVNSREEAVEKLRWYLTKIARLGGYLDRANDPPPGIIVMWRGLARLTDLATGYSIANEKCG